MKVIEQLKSLAIVATHNGVFHTDEVAAYSLLCVVCDRLGIDSPGALIRTRDPLMLENCSMQFDVGLEYDRDKLRFDHHQADDKLPARHPRRHNHRYTQERIRYSSFGLVFDWLKPAMLELGLDEKDLAAFEVEYILPVDASDNGQDLVAEYNYEVLGEHGEKPKGPDRYIQPVVLQHIVNSYRPRWDEDEDMDVGFMQAASLVKRLLNNKIGQLLASHKVRELVDGAVRRCGIEAKILDFNGPFFPWQGAVLDSGSLALFVIFFDNASGTWRVQAVPKKIGSFENRAVLPRMEELPPESHLADGILFIHKAGFIAGGTREACLALAEYAVHQL